MPQESQAPLPQIFNGQSYHHVVEHKICIEGGKPIEIKVHCHLTAEIVGVKEFLSSLLTLGERMARTLDETLAAVEAANTKQDSLIALFKGLKQQLADIIAGNLPPAVQAKVDQLFDSVTAQAKEVSDALDENVPPTP